MPAARDFARLLHQLAATEATVLLEGESGVGKNRAAREIHARSRRAQGPLVEIDLATLAPTLLEAELFGHEAGAFTGADHARPGRFVRAQGGTIVLDGVERLPEAAQAKLLRVLQERVVEPLGGEHAVSIDARVLATCVQDLAGLVRAGRFRTDLYYRLAVVRLRVPSLRERLSELPVLAAELAVQAARRLGVPERPFSAAALAALAVHPWPGNVRELENAIERVLVLSPGPAGAPIAAEELGFLCEAIDGAAQRLAREALAQGVELPTLEAAFAEAALLETRGNIAAAARRMGITRRALELRVARRRSAESLPDDESGSA